MLLAGASLGVFASRAFSLFPPTGGAHPVAARRTIEDRVRYYRERFRLDETQAERIRQALIAYEQDVDSKLFEIRKVHEREFQALRDGMQAKIDAVLASTGR
jgi:hypothetical protein